MKKLLATGGSIALALVLTGCELRRDGAEGEPATDVTEQGEPPATEPSPTPSESASPSVSIIRQDAAPSAVEEQQPVVEPVQMVLPFPDGSDIDAAIERRLVGLMQQPAIDEDWPVVLSGHTDSGGNDQASLRASRARAEAVAAWLVERGVADERIEVIAFGEQNPIQPNALPDGSAN